MAANKQALIVDDEPDIQEGVSRRLTAAGFETHCVGDGEACLEFMKTHAPDVVILDVLMPRLNGLQTLEALRACPQSYHIPVVMLSASLRDEQRALDAGATFFIQKPFDPRKLIAAVKTAVTCGEATCLKI